MYHRRARGLSGLLRNPQATWRRLTIERPYGPLPLERQNPTATKRQGSDVLHLVGMGRFELPISGPPDQRLRPNWATSRRQAASPGWRTYHSAPGPLSANESRVRAASARNT